MACSTIPQRQMSVVAIHCKLVLSNPKSIYLGVQNVGLCSPSPKPVEYDLT